LSPLFWLDEHFEIDKVNADKFNREVKLPLDVINVGKYVVFVVGMILILVCAGYSFVIWKRNQVVPELPVVTETTPLINN
jgi:hypothetical protein